MSRTFRVVRNCCTSGNCFECRGTTPYGKPMRIEQARGYTKQRAEIVARNWKSYDASVELEARS